MLTVPLVGCEASTSSTTATTASSGTAAGSAASIRLTLDEKAPQAAVFEVLDLPADDAARLAQVEWDESQWNAVLAVYVAGDRLPEDGDAARPRSLDATLLDASLTPADRPAVLGTHRVLDGVLRFEPQYPLQPGVAYDVVLDLARIPRESAADESPSQSVTFAACAPLVQRFVVHKPEAVATTVVERVTPTANVLPENLLKFYLHFSAPMSRGEAYRRVHLLNSSGREVERPFLELDEELWDPGGKRLTLFFDPGRVKRELVPRLEMGPALVEGNTYALVIDRDWLDANGNRLLAPFRTEFRAVAPDDKPPSIDSWKVTSPKAGTSGHLEVSFPEPLDQALLMRQLWIENDRGEILPGTIHTTDAETRWQFTPQAAWPAGTYRLQVDTTLEDLAGNSIGRPFEVDVFESVERRVEPKKVSIPFEVRPAKPTK